MLQSPPHPRSPALDSPVAPHLSGTGEPSTGHSTQRWLGASWRGRGRQEPDGAVAAGAGRAGALPCSAASRARRVPGWVLLPGGAPGARPRPPRLLLPRTGGSRGPCCSGLLAEERARAAVARRDVTVTVTCPREQNRQHPARFQMSLEGPRVVTGPWGSFCVPRTALLARCWALLERRRSPVASPHRGRGSGAGSRLGAWVGGWGSGKREAVLRWDVSPSVPVPSRPSVTGAPWLQTRHGQSSAWKLPGGHQAGEGRVGTDERGEAARRGGGELRRPCPSCRPAAAG